MPIEVHDAAMRRIAPEGADIELLQDGFQFLEGPVWDHRRRLLYFSDIPADTLYQFTPGEGATVVRRPSRHSNGNTIDGQGRLLTL